MFWSLCYLTGVETLSFGRLAFCMSVWVSHTGGEINARSSGDIPSSLWIMESRSYRSMRARPATTLTLATSAVGPDPSLKVSRCQRRCT